MNYWNSPLVEAVAETGVKTGTFEGPIPLVAEVHLGLAGCSGSLESTVLSGTFFRERQPRSISVGFGAIRIIKSRLEVSQLITNHYYLERKGML